MTQSSTDTKARSNGHRRVARLERLRKELPVTAMGATGTLAMRLRDLTGRDVIDLESLQELVSLGYRAADVRRTHRDGRYDIDDFGFDRDFTNAVVPLFRLLYKRYWRVATTGINVVPRTGAALLVSNHSGVLPFDGAMIEVAVLEAVDRYTRALVASWFGGLPMLSWFLRRTGQTLGHPDDSLRLLKRGELVLVFPEGVRGTGKPFSERYRLRRFGRGGFVEVALRAGVPIIPISVVGSEEIYPMIGDLQVVAKLLGMPYFPITPTWPWLGPLGLVPLPSKWRIRFHEAVRTEDYGADAADDPATVMRISDQVRDTIQAGLVAELMERRSIFRG
jgi:1-acyl-sn-glycerol-3-phosphate acyltransferase